MKIERTTNIPESESGKKIALELPAVESFLDPIAAAEVWPEEISANLDFLEQVENRRELNDRLNTVLDQLPRPDMPLMEAIRQGSLTETQVSDLYESLSELLENDSDYRRIVLYLPFEFLLANDWQTENAGLQKSMERFKAAYMEAWKSLLTVHDYRANFIDGDLLEVYETESDVPQVVKAAHLIPELATKGLMKPEEAISLLEETDDEILKNSLADSLMVMADLGLIGEAEIKQMAESDDRLANAMGKIIASNIKSEKKEDEKAADEITLESVQNKLKNEYARIDAGKYEDITANRKKWLVEEKKLGAIEASGREISRAVASGEFSDEILAEFLDSKADFFSQEALIEGIRLAIESIAPEDKQKAQGIYERFRTSLERLWENDNAGINEIMSKMYRRLFQLEIIDDQKLAELRIFIPKMDGSFPDNLELMASEISGIRSAVELIKSNPELARMVYPMAMIYGSRIKGYGTDQSDIDISVLVKPGTPASDRRRLTELLESAFVGGKIKGQVLEFWLEENNNKLYIKDFPELDAPRGNSRLINVLFASVWEGDKEVMAEVRAKLLSPYILEADKKIDGQEARALHLKEMERDALQYRLMHKGYERFYPPYGGIDTPHSDEIDGESMFWDSGYRQLATKLFVSRVFLPKVQTK